MGRQRSVFRCPFASEVLRNRCIGFLVWLPILRPALATTAYYNTAAAFAFIGGTIFEIGSYLMVVEALDR